MEMNDRVNEFGSKHRPGQISASMMCAELACLERTVRLLEKSHIDYLHIDVMDGEFVPNFGLGVDYINGLRQITDIPFDIHLMVQRPEDKVGWLKIRPSDSISLHFESTIHIQRALEQIRKFGCKVMLAINPATPVCSIEESMEYIDGVTLLTVNPGFAGQKIVHSCIKKAERLRKMVDNSGFSNLLIEVDGNISFQNAEIFKHLGADIFVAGSSSLFSGGIENLEENILRFKSIVD